MKNVNGGDNIKWERIKSIFNQAVLSTTLICEDWAVVFQRHCHSRPAWIQREITEIPSPRSSKHLKYQGAPLACRCVCNLNLKQSNHDHATLYRSRQDGNAWVGAWPWFNSFVVQPRTYTAPPRPPRQQHVTRRMVLINVPFQSCRHDDDIKAS